MLYCRYCGVEITYKRSKNEKWIPCDLLTGEPHFCQEKKEDAKSTGIRPCSVCGKPVFVNQKGKKKILYDYTSLAPHICKKADITRYAKFQQKNTKAEMSKRSATLRSKNMKKRKLR